MGKWEIPASPLAGTWFVRPYDPPFVPSQSLPNPSNPAYPSPSLQQRGLTSPLQQPEFAHPYKVLSSQCEIIVASPNGGEAPLDPSSVEAFKEDAVCSKFLKHSESLWKNTHKLSEFAGKAKEFEAIFFVGGHGRTFTPLHLPHSLVPPNPSYYPLFGLCGLLE